MTIEIKQVDREDLKSAFRTSDVPAKNIALRKAYDAIGAYEARIAELERERDAADLSRTAYARALEKMRIALVNVHDGMEDEGDRIYLGSTNHADDLKAAWHAADALQWEVVLADTQPKTDVVKANLHLQSELAAAEARLAEAVKVIRSWNDWYRRATADDDCDYLNGEGWSDASETWGRSARFIQETERG